LPVEGGGCLDGGRGVAGGHMLGVGVLGDLPVVAEGFDEGVVPSRSLR
jgi:hypothetical protein